MKKNNSIKWVKYLNNTLVIPNNKNKPLCLDLFSGCGGMGLGFESAGFKTIGYEKDKSAFLTYKNNLNECLNVELKKNQIFKKFDILIGGPPCQPFSVGGNQKGPRDSRDGFPIILDVAERYKPKIIIIENVRGLFYRNNKYLIQILNELKSLEYSVTYKLLNSVHFNVPQRRERVFIIATKVGWRWPIEDKKNKVTVSDAIGDTMNKSNKNSDFLTPGMDKYILNYEIKSKCINPRDLYPDQPSRTLTCRNLGGSTSDMIRVKLSNGKRRRITHKEAARLQSFPDWFNFSGNKYKIFEQIGNAVPPLLAYSLAKQCMIQLKKPTDFIEDPNKQQLELMYG